MVTLKLVGNRKLCGQISYQDKLGVHGCQIINIALIFREMRVRFVVPKCLTLRLSQTRSSAGKVAMASSANCGVHSIMPNC